MRVWFIYKHLLKCLIILSDYLVKIWIINITKNYC